MFWLNLHLKQWTRKQVQAVLRVVRLLQDVSHQNNIKVAPLRNHRVSLWNTNQRFHSICGRFRHCSRCEAIRSPPFSLKWEDSPVQWLYQSGPDKSLQLIQSQCTGGQDHQATGNPCHSGLTRPCFVFIKSLCQSKDPFCGMTPFYGIALDCSGSRFSCGVWSLSFASLCECYLVFKVSNS